MSSIEIEDVSKVFGNRNSAVCALRDVNLAVRSGEFISVVGPSGCGKSTLVKLISGLIAPSAGKVLVDGRIAARPRDSVSLMLQKPVLLPWRSVRANVLLPAELRGLDTKRYIGLADSLLCQLGLRDFADLHPYQLSLGMQQRVALCRALIGEPRLILMDEPFAALDEIARERIGLELLRIQQTQGKTIVFITHSIAEAAFLSDRVAILSERPGSVKGIVGIPFPRPRELALLGSSAFAEVTGQIRRLIHCDYC